MRTVTVREFARLTTGEADQTLDRAAVSETAFDYLCRLASGFRRGGATLLEVESRRWLRLDGYVGVIETPCGTTVEILPKHVDTQDEGTLRDARKLLHKLLQRALDLPARDAGQASLERFDYPLTEWVMSRFLLALEDLVSRGVRSEYVKIDETQRFLRGQLDLMRQLRQAPGRDHVFNIRHDVYLPDRPENRLIKTALLKVCDRAQRADNWRHSREMLALFAEVPASVDVTGDFRRWRSDRLIAHYAQTRPWCELILGGRMPVSLVGEARGLSFLFPMERLFERTVASSLRRQMPAKASLTEQSTRHALCTHLEQATFTLKPDIFIEGQGESKLVLDAKWKRLDATLRDQQYGLSQSDFYQVFAYGSKYLRGAGDLFLVYPATERFSEPLHPFLMSEQMRLWVVPFDLEREQIVWPNSMKQYELFGLLTTYDAVASGT